MVLNLPEFGDERQRCFGIMTKVLGAAQRFRRLAIAIATPKESQPRFRGT
jgi:hypothetical protein